MTKALFVKKKEKKRKIDAGILLFVFLGDHHVRTGLSMDFEKLMLFMF